MIFASPLESHVLFAIGPVPISQPVATTWGIMAVLTIGSWLLTRRLALRPTRAQAALELVVETVAGQIRETMEAEPRRYLPLIGTLFLFLLVANWSSLIPGVEPPTATLETDAALALIVFGATLWFGVRALGPRTYLATFARPSIPSLRARLPAWIDDHVPDLCAQIERTGQIDTAQRSALITTVKALIESQPAGSAS
jgi:F-type H+-transporting ATPase subunit a